MSYKLNIYNSATKKKEPLPINNDLVSIYTCGPTVYDRSTLGNLRAMLVYDYIYRGVSFLGLKPKWVMNYTDVGHLVADADTGEDKIAKKAREEKKTAWQIAEANIKQFEEDIATLRIAPADKKSVFRVRATDEIEQMKSLVKTLNEKGFLYPTADGLYFDTSKYPEYGQFGELNIAGLQEGARVDKNPEKKNPTDFAIWKFSPKDSNRDMEWDNPVGEGKGFPGWHLECSAIINHQFNGETISIHAGGVDLKPTHHQNEIAQSESAYEKKLSETWVHIHHLMVDGHRMGKSEGNMLTISDLLEKGFSPLDYRYFVCTAHYRSKQNFTWDALSAAKRARFRLSRILASEEWSEQAINQEVLEQIKMAVADDFDLPKALALLWQYVDKNKGRKISSTLKAIDQELFNFLDREVTAEPAIPKEVEELLKSREQARGQADFQQADKLRLEIESRGYIIEDTKDGPKLILK